MNNLDQQYIAGLADLAVLGDSNAFAELYAATFQQQYRFSYDYLQDEYLARDALQETYIQVLRNLNSLQDSGLFLPWLSYLNYHACLERRLPRTSPTRSSEDLTFSIGDHEYTLRQLRILPFTEAQALSMRYFDHMPIRRIARLLYLRPTAVSRYLRRGEKRLRAILNL